MSNDNENEDFRGRLSFSLLLSRLGTVLFLAFGPMEQLSALK